MTEWVVTEHPRTPTQKDRNDTARRLVDTWQKYLRLDDWEIRCVFVHDTSFETGGVAEIELGFEPNVAILALAVERLEVDLENTIASQLLRLLDHTVTMANN